MLLNRIGWNPNLVAELKIAPQTVEELSSQLLDFCEQFKSCFIRSEKFFNAIAYIKGLADDDLFKTIETIVIAVLGAQKLRSLQHFFTGANWEADHLTGKNQELLAVKSSAEGGMFTFDSSEISKKGKDSASLVPQHCGHLGKVANCQSGVFLGYVSEKGYGLLDQQFYVSEVWFTAGYTECWAKAKIRFPNQLGFKTKLGIALELLAKAEATGAFGVTPV